MRSLQDEEHRRIQGCRSQRHCCQRHHSRGDVGRDEQRSNTDERLHHIRQQQNQRRHFHPLICLK
jgi:hypothetical protein